MHLVACAALLLAVSFGARQSMALFLSTLNTTTGLGIATVSLAFAIGQLWWGLTQPVAGGFADKYGSARVMVVGALMIALGLALTPWATNLPMLVLCIAILGAGGAGALGPSVMMSAVTRSVGEAKRGMATGIVNAGGSLGQFIIVPITQAMISGWGWMMALWGLSLLTLMAMPLIAPFRQAMASGPAAAAGQSVR